MWYDHADEISFGRTVRFFYFLQLFLKMKFAIFLIRNESYSAKLADKIAWFFVTISLQLIYLTLGTSVE